MTRDGIWSLAAEVRVTCPVCHESFYVTMEGERTEEFDCDYCDKGRVEVSLTITVNVDDLSEEDDDAEVA